MKIAGDKVVHLLAGAVIAIVTLLITENSFFAIMMAAILGAAKEWWDGKGHGTVEFADFFATLIGGILAIGGVVLWNIILHSIR